MRLSGLNLLLACLILAVSGCGTQQTQEAQFQSNLDEAIKAAEKGKEIVKAPTTKRR